MAKLGNFFFSEAKFESGKQYVFDLIQKHFLRPWSNSASCAVKLGNICVRSLAISKVWKLKYLFQLLLSLTLCSFTSDSTEHISRTQIQASCDGQSSPYDTAKYTTKRNETSRCIARNAQWSIGFYKCREQVPELNWFSVWALFRVS